MTMTINLSSKELCAIVAKALELPADNVKPSRYGVAVQNITPEELTDKLNNYLKVT